MSSFTETSKDSTLGKDKNKHGSRSLLLAVPSRSNNLKCMTKYTDGAVADRASNSPGATIVIWEQTSSHSNSPSKKGSKTFNSAAANSLLNVLSVTVQPAKSSR